MFAKFEDPEMELGKEYKGEIRRYTLDELNRVFYVYIKIDELGFDFEYVKKFEYNLNVNSEFGVFCDNVVVIPNHQFVDLDELLGKKVVVIMGKNARGILYINEIYRDHDYYDELWRREYEQRQE